MGIPLNRRQFIQVGGAGLATLLLTGKQFLVVSQDKTVRPKGTADACIFINLLGGPSHVDTFDLKPGPWTPTDFKIEDIGKMQLSTKLFPQLSKHSKHLTAIRSLQSWDLEHTRAQYSLHAARVFNPGFVNEIPHVGSIIGFEFASRGGRGPFPPFICFNGTTIGSGFISTRYEPFSTYAYVSNIGHPQGEERFLRRWKLLDNLDRPLRREDAPQGRAYKDFHDIYLGAKGLTNYPPFEEAFTLTDEERERYGKSDFGDACNIAHKLLKANKGTHFIQINHDGWDHHFSIYSEENLPTLCKQLDAGVSAMITDLSQTRVGRFSRKSDSLFDRTLIIIMGEFGRTAGSLNNRLGRDHHGVQAALLLGGGIKGGRTIGTTDSNGEKIIDFGWKEKRALRIEDIVATIYSSLGIDWTKVIRETPSGRPFAYVSYSTDGLHTEISELF